MAMKRVPPFVQWAARMQKKIPVLALTANAFVDDVIKAKKAGMNGHLAKPVDADKMIALVKKWLFLPENFRTK